ncbi:unnamed protein product [Arctogadus glacialis]
MDCPTPVTSRSDFENHCHIFQLRVSHSRVLPAEPVPGPRGSSTRKFCRLAWNREKFETWLFLRAPLCPESLAAEGISWLAEEICRLAEGICWLAALEVSRMAEKDPVSPGKLKTIL